MYSSSHLCLIRRGFLIRVLALFLLAFVGFWLGSKQACSHTTLRQDEEEKLNLFAKTAKFKRESRKHALITNCCKKTKNGYNLQDLPRRDASNLFRHIIVDKKNKLLYCYVPKVASSNMERMILTLQGMSDSSDAIKYYHRRGFDFLEDFSLEEKEEILKTFYKFLFVRDPRDRLISAYRNKFAGKNNQFHVQYGREIVKRYRKNYSSPAVPGNDVTFREFIRYVIDEEPATMNEHWMPIYNLCQPCYIQYNFVGGFEQLDLDIKSLLENINASKTVTFPKRQKYYLAPLSSIDIDLFYQNVTFEEYKSLNRQYWNDFNCFNYPFRYNMPHVPSS